MKTRIRYILFTFLFFCHFNKLKSQNISFIKSYNYDQFDFGNCVQQTSDGGFMLFGESSHNNTVGPMEMYLELVKTDASGNVLWNNSFGLPGLINFGVSAKQTFDDGFILCGSYGDLGNDTLVLVKTDAAGNEVWHNTYSAHNNRDVGQSVLQTTDSGYIAVGFEGGGQNPSVYLVKTDKNGSLQWSKSFPQSGYELGQCIKKASSDGYIICGRTNSKGNGQYDIYLMRINSNGDSLWTKTFGTDSSEYGNAVDVTDDGGYIITGNDYFPGGDIWLIKTDSSGNQQWVKKFGGTGWDFGNDVKQCSDGGFVIAGRREINSNSNQFYCFKTDNTGNLIWDHVFPKGMLSEAYSVFQNDDDGFIFSGQNLNATGDSADFYYIRLDSTGSLSVPSVNLNDNNKIILFPNPASGIINILIQTENMEKAFFEITDLSGRIIYKKQETEATNILDEQFDLSGFQTGFYILRIHIRDKIISRRIIKN